jgi:hypothetical protein
MMSGTLRAKKKLVLADFLHVTITLAGRVMTQPARLQLSETVSIALETLEFVVEIVEMPTETSLAHDATPFGNRAGINPSGMLVRVLQRLFQTLCNGDGYDLLMQCRMHGMTYLSNPLP